jgi:hypothetical protein
MTISTLFKARSGFDIPFAVFPSPGATAASIAGTEEKAHRTGCLVAWRGRSEIDGTPIRVIAYCLERGSNNSKLGPMGQIMFAPDDEAPNLAVKSGRDEAVCGECVNRPANLGTCYVVPTFPLLAPWYSTRERSADIESTCRAIGSRPIRIGSWGDPAAVPFKVIRVLVDATRLGARRRHTAYTQRWRTCDQRFREVAMASVISPKERENAKRQGWRTFRVRTADMPVLAGEIVCPASLEGGEKLTCAKCLLCNGASSAKDIVVVAHGSKNKVRKLEQLVQLRVNAVEDRVAAGGAS